MFLLLKKKKKTKNWRIHGIDILELFLYEHKNRPRWCSVSVTHQHNEQLFGLLFAISFSRLSGARVASPFHLLFAKSKKRVRNFTLSRTHCSGCVIHDENTARIVFSRSSATGYNFLYTWRNDYPVFFICTLFQCINRLRCTIYQKIITFTYATKIINTILIAGLFDSCNIRHTCSFDEWVNYFSQFLWKQH